MTLFAKMKFKVLAGLALCGVVGCLTCSFEELEDPAFSPGFFWVMNDRLEASKLEAQLDDMVAHGCRSVCWHAMPKGFSAAARTAMEPDYLTDGYLAVYSNAVECAAARGMNFWLYDEGGWPSGSACGQVMRGTGDRFRRRYLVPEADGSFRVEFAKEDPAKRMTRPSVIEPGATDRFIALTHERIRRWCGHHFGKTIRFAFMDEPIFPFCNPGKSLGWCSDFAEQFKARKGYDILPHARAIVESDAPYADALFEPLYENRKPCRVTDEVARVRIDYYDVMSHLFLERFILPIRDWCRRNGLKSGGHFGGEDQVEGNALFGYGHILRDLRALDCPGVDTIWRQLWPTNAMNMPFPRYAASAAHQAGGNHVLSESYAVYGGSMSPLEMKWVADYQMVRGVTMFVCSAYPLAGNPTNNNYRIFGPDCHAWDYQKPFFDYCAATCARLAQGKPDIDTAVLFDIRGIWAGGQYRTEAADRHAEVARALDRGHVDFDFVDDDQIAAAEVRDGRLVVGEMAYGTVVLPTWKWMLPAAAANLEEFARAGGRVVRGTDVSSVPPTCAMRGAGHEDIRVTRRRLGGRTLSFFVNESMAVREVELEGIGRKRFGPCESFFHETGDPAPAAEEEGETREIGGWRPALGDWRVRKGEAFSGCDTYRATFRHAGGRATLDLGRVCWYCKARLNGRELEPKGFPPYAWEVELKAGENALEVEVANTLANRFAAVKVKTPYDRYIVGFNRLNHESGLFGPVTVRGPGTALVAADARLEELADRGTLTVLDFGAKGDGVTDDTAAIQRGIDWVNARGGGVLRFPFRPKGYLIAAPAKEFARNGRPLRAQIELPPGNANIVLEGEMPCKLLYAYQVRPLDAGKNNYTPTRFGRMPANNTYLHSTWDAPEVRDPKERPWSVIAAPEGDGCRGRFSRSMLTIRNLEVRAHHDRERMYPTTSAAFLKNVSRLIIEDSQFCLDENVGDALEGKYLKENPCHAVGLHMSGDQNDEQILRNVAVQGFRYGFVFGEHVTAEHLYVHNCENAVCFHDSTHLSVLNHVVAQHNRRILVALDDGLYGNGADEINVAFRNLNFEGGQTTGVPPFVSHLEYGVWDPGNRLRGSITWHEPWGKGEFPVKGAAKFRVERFAR